MSYFLYFFAPRKEAKPRIELRAKKGNFYDETMAADNEKEEEIEDEEVRFSRKIYLGIDV